MTERELRRTFHDELSALQQRVDEIALVVVDGIDAATRALLSGDVSLAQRVVAGDARIDAVYPEVELEVFNLVARQAPVARDLRFLVATLRIAQEIERSGDLIASVAKRVGVVEPGALEPPIADLIDAMGLQAGNMYREAAASYSVLDGARAAAVRASDDAMDDLHRRLLRALITAPAGSVGSTVELALVARFYERVADHAVVVAERVRFVVDGEMFASDADEQTYRGRLNRSDQ